MSNEFVNKNPYDYNSLLNSAKIQHLIAGIPSGLSDTEIAYYVYLELGKIVKHDPDLFFCLDEDRAKKFNNNIDEEFYGICKSISELYVSILKRLNIEADLIKKVPNSDISHFDVAIKTDGKVYIANLISDLVRIKTGRRTVGFGCNFENIIKIKLKHFKSQLIDNGVNLDSIDDVLMKSFKTLDFSELNESLDGLENSLKDEKLKNRLKKLKRNISYYENMRKEYPNLSFLNNEELERMNDKFGHSYQVLVPSYENESKKEHTYINEAYDIIKKEALDESILNEVIFEGKDVEKAEELEYKLDYICKIMSHSIPNNGETGYLEDIRSAIILARQILNKDELKRVIPYGIQIGNDSRNIISVLKVLPSENIGTKLYYIYSKDKRTYEKVDVKHLKQFISKSDYVSVVSIGYTFDSELAKLTKKEISDELEI